MSIWLMLVAAAATFLLGGLWYGPLFHKVWLKENGFPADYEAGHPARVFGLSFLLAFLAAAGYAHLIGFSDDVLRSTVHGAAAGALIAGTSFGINYLFCGKSLKLWLIDAGYHTVQFALFGAIFAGLHEII